MESKKKSRKEKQDFGFGKKKIFLDIESKDHEDIGYLYIIKDVKNHSRWYKVGKTSNPDNRISHYNVAFPEQRVEFIYVSSKIDSLSYAENKLIEYLKYCGFPQKKKEWFRDNDKINKNFRVYVKKAFFEFVNIAEDRLYVE
jgi:hypothetical protein